MSTSVTRVVNLYAMHARSGNDVLDYKAFFEHLAQLPSTSTAIRITSEVNFAIADAKMNGDLFTAKIVAGSPDEVPLYFDYMTGVTETGSTPDGKWLARISRVVIKTNQDHRALALEASGSGVTANRLELYFRRLAAEIGWLDGLTFDLPPVPAPSLREEIESFERIREASAAVTRPNFDWSDFDTKLSDLAAESGGHVAEAVVRAGRGESLAKTGGIIGIILGSLSVLNPSLKGFRIIGRKRGASKEVTVSSKKHNQRTFFESNISDKSVEFDTKMLAAAEDLIQLTPKTLLDSQQGE